MESQSGWAKQGPWWRWPVIISGILIASTYAYAFWRVPGAARVWGYFSLGTEHSIATWWSGALLLWYAALCWQISRVLWTRSRLDASAMLVMTGLGLAMFADEMGSLHERVDLFVPIPGDAALLPFALAGVLLLAFALTVMRRHRERFGKAWWLVGLAFVLFGSVYLQEFAEHHLDWPTSLLPLRVTLEEGTEIVGMLLLIVSAAHIVWRLQQVGRPYPSLFQLLPDRSCLQAAIVLTTVLAVPVITLRWIAGKTLHDFWFRGDFGLVIPIGLFGLAAAECVRRMLLAHGRRWSWGFLAMACVLVSVDLEINIIPRWHLGADLSYWSVPLLLAASLSVTWLRDRLTGVLLGGIWGLAAVAMHVAVLPISYAVLYLLALAVAGNLVVHGDGSGPQSVSLKNDSATASRC